MKNILESSIYLVLMSFICIISVQFIIINTKVSKVNEVATYIENYIEANGTCISKQKTIKKIDTNGNIIDGIGDEPVYYKYDNTGKIVEASDADINNDNITVFPIMQQEKLDALQKITNSYGFDVKWKYIASTNNYGYIEYTVGYKLNNSLIGWKKTHTYQGLARFSLDT